MNSFHVWFLIFICIGYLIVTDQSIAQLFVLLFKLARVQYEKIKWYVQYSPDNPFLKFMLHRKYLKIAKKLHKELVKKD